MASSPFNVLLIMLEVIVIVMCGESGFRTGKSLPVYVYRYFNFWQILPYPPKSGGHETGLDNADSW